MISVAFAIITFVPVHVLLDVKYAVVMAAFSGALTSFAFLLRHIIYEKRTLKRLSCVADAILFKCASAVDIPSDTVKAYEYGSVFKHIKGLCIHKTDGASAGFAVSEQNYREIADIAARIQKGEEL